MLEMKQLIWYKNIEHYLNIILISLVSWSSLSHFVYFYYIQLTFKNQTLLLFFGEY
jgi:hypothetical protein